MKRREFLKTATVALATQLGSGHLLGEHSQHETKAREIAGIYPVNLRCEYATNPIGIDVAQPRLSWTLEPGVPGLKGLEQTAYQILVATSLDGLSMGKGDRWDTGKTRSSQSTQITYGGMSLTSRQSSWWKVRTWDQADKVSDWSEPALWSMGLLQPSDWKGKWIGVNGGEEIPEEFREASWISGSPARSKALFLRRRFELDEGNPPSYGLLAAVGSGAVAVHINGNKINSPSTKHSERYVAQAITEMMHPGHNVVAVRVDCEGDTAAVLAGITFDLADGAIRHIRTDKLWRASTIEQTNWEKPEFEDTDWQSASLAKSSELPESAKKGERTRLPARMLRKEFHLADSPQRATVYLSGLGYHELYINGKKVGRDVLAPALTDYDKRALYVTYDVTEFARKGDNAIGVVLGNGRFYAPRKNIPTYTRTFGYPRMILQLHVEYPSGEQIIFTSDGTWKATTAGPIHANNYYDGEEYDARMEQTGWALPNFSEQGWTAVEIVDPPAGVLRAQMNEPIRVMREVKPVKMTQLSSGVYVFDMGQNMVGWCRVKVSAAKGTHITLRHAETLRPNGTLYTDNLRSARQTDTYIAKGAGVEIYEPRFVSHGFRYVEIRGFPGTPSLSTIIGRVANDALAEHADLTTSNEVINHVYRNVLWGDRGNYQSIPTDCSQRDERQGWLGDRSAESTGESYMFDVSRFYTKWVQDIEDSMDSDGRINDVAPAYWPFYNENVVWPASFFIVTDMLRLQYGDNAIVKRHYPAMKRWVGHMQPFIKGDLMPIDVYGDWCVPPKSLTVIHSDDPATKTAAEILGTAYFYYILRLMSGFSVVSGHAEDRDWFDGLAVRMKIAFNAKYLNTETGVYDNGTQTSSILPLAVGIAPEGHRKKIFDTLINNIEIKTTGHVGAGLVGAQWLMQTLARNGRPDVSTQIASQTTYPSWGYMISRGATTIWELWNGDTANPAMNSRNHLMLLGDFGSWLYENVAGIKSDPEHPGFKHIILRPMANSNLTFAKASCNSPHGRIATSWNLDGDAFTLHVSIPPNTTGTVYVPTADHATVRENGELATRSEGVKLIWSMPGIAVYRIGSGEYSFTSKVAPRDGHSLVSRI